MAMPEKIGKYEIQDVLGKGGMGVVYKAFDPAISRGVAIKAITKSSLGPGEISHVMERFRHEAQAVGRLMHPGIVQIYDYGEDEETAFIVMELINGKTLHQHLTQELRYEVREVGAIVHQLLDAMGHAHGKGVVHRDIKPSNIMINSDGLIKVSDFGIARIEASDLTQVGDVLGTPHYMAPEQFLGADVDKLADLFSIGVIAYELLTGKKPFSGNSAMVMHQVLNTRPVDPSRVNPALSPRMDRVLHIALAKNREERFPSAREFSEAFREALDATLNSSVGLTAAAGASGAALLGAARLLDTGRNASGTPPGETEPPPTLDSAISLDTRIRKARLLLIDDEERILAALKSLFRNRYHVFVTTDGNKALDFIRKYHMHVIVCDQRMPQMTGVELLRQSREISPHSVRILLTGYADLVAIVGSINESEVYRFIAKPWDHTELLTAVAEGATIALELAEARPETPDLPDRMEAGVLVIDRDEEIFRVTRELVGGLCPVVYAADFDAALATMKEQEIAVVITDVESGGDSLTATLKKLKQEKPHVVTIVVTTASDSELVIGLINEAQIFRFLNKPVSVRLLKGHVHAALQRYLAYTQPPRPPAEQGAAPETGRTRDASLGKRLLGGIKTLRGRWSGDE